MANPRVAIAGAGVAAAAAAILLREAGIEALMLGSTREVSDGVEAVPYVALSALPSSVVAALLELPHVRGSEGFADLTETSFQSRLPARYLVLNRRHLRHVLVAEALRRDARLQVVQRLPAVDTGHASTDVQLTDRSDTFTAAIDATGRSARWIGATRRQGNAVAVMYRTGALRRAAGLLRFDGGWAYAVSTRLEATLGVVSPLGQRLADALLAERFEVSGPIVQIGRRPAFVQWTASPVRGRLLAIGDSALAYDPVSGHGVRFAISSAVSAVSAIRTIANNPGDLCTVQDFHADFVASARDRHLQHLQAPPPPREIRALPVLVQFRGTIAACGLNVDGLIQPGEAIILPDGGRVRWIAGFDLLQLRELAKTPVPARHIVGAAVDVGMSHTTAFALVSWCLQRGLLSPTND